MSEVLRTPDERFNELPGFPYAPNYLDNLEGYEGLRMHYVDEGPRDAANVFLCLHGEPTWSYLYRKMIPVFTAAGHRVVAPDYFGFGRSDKPVPDDVYQFDFHRDSLLAFIAQLDLASLTIVCQDWGGLLGLTLPMEIPDRISRLLIMNTALGTGDVKLSEGFVAWRNYVQDTPDFDVGRLMKRSCPLLTDGEIAAYNAPFPDARYKAGVRRFPAMVPDHPQAPGAELSRRAREWLKTAWSGESFMAVGMQDPVLGPPVMKALRKLIQGCPEPFEITEAGHFVQEWGEVVARKALEAFGI
ncbi:MAG: alpha/beta fold hydrolase [Deltaproteobacteria bacterium]|jgi:pimeloyl-ACP methyl ester carboxylesterase|nr:alpha/beta fold hydrolase [Deltaproteobacteria bacterium]MBW2482394.1 alpha/beta fold hydrolase [Deltaproteobacteria bacterium]